ncbi:MAG: ATP-binding protein, partial [Phycisphaerae bacterium]
MTPGEQQPPVVTKNFLMHLAKGGVKCVPLAGGLLEEMIFGTLEGEAAEKDALELKNAIARICTEERTQTASLIEVLADMAELRSVQDETRSLIKSLATTIDNLDHTAVPDVVTESVTKYLPKRLHQVRVALSKMPITSPELFGREKELAILDEAWNDANVGLVSLVAFGGVGKTALVNRWLLDMREQSYRGARRVLGWSFYSQGAAEGKQASADLFIDHALRWFGDPDPTQGSPWEKGERLAALVNEQPTLLVLDGLEPLQHPPSSTDHHGGLQDPALQTLLREVARHNTGLCVLTTRIKVEDIQPFVGTSVRRIDLEQLSPEAGAELLRGLKVNGTDDDLQEAVKDFGGHALALTLLGNYLGTVHKGDVRKRDLVPELMHEPTAGGHARRVMESYEKWFERKPELQILRIMGLFDRPAAGGAIKVLKESDPIGGLTSDLVNLSHGKWQFALSRLREARLLAKEDPDDPETLDCHPLIREHFADKLRAEHPKAWKQAHRRLYEYFRDLPAKELPDTLEEMAPLFQAVTHGCHAGRYQEAYKDVYWRRMCRGNAYFVTRFLGGFGEDLATLAGFFEAPWTRPSSMLDARARRRTLAIVGYDLRSLGRVYEAVRAFKGALDLERDGKIWGDAGITADNLSLANLLLGRTQEAVE